VKTLLQLYLEVMADGRDHLLQKQVVTIIDNEKTVEQLNPTNLLALTSDLQRLGLLHPTEWFRLYLDESCPGVNSNKLAIANTLMCIYQKDPGVFNRYLAGIKKLNSLKAKIKILDAKLVRQEQEKTVVKEKWIAAKRTLETARFKNAMRLQQFKSCLNKIEHWDVKGVLARLTVMRNLTAMGLPKISDLPEAQQKRQLRAFIKARIEACRNDKPVTELGNVHNLKRRLPFIKEKIGKTRQSLEGLNTEIESLSGQLKTLIKVISNPEAKSEVPRFTELSCEQVSSLYQQWLLLAIACKEENQAKHAAVLAEFEKYFEEGVRRLRLAFPHELHGAGFAKLFVEIDSSYIKPRFVKLLQQLQHLNTVTAISTAEVAGSTSDPNAATASALKYLDCAMTVFQAVLLCEAAYGLALPGDEITDAEAMKLLIASTVIIASGIFNLALSSLDKINAVQPSNIHLMVRKGVVTPYFHLLAANVFGTNISPKLRSFNNSILYTVGFSYALFEVASLYKLLVAKAEERSSLSTTANLMESTGMRVVDTTATAIASMNRAGAGGPAGAGSDPEARAQARRSYAREEDRRSAEQKAAGEAVTPSPRRP
jgi:hypothetical protein